MLLQRVLLASGKTYGPDLSEFNNAWERPLFHPKNTGGVRHPVSKMTMRHVV